MRSKKLFGITIATFTLLLSCNEQKKEPEQPTDTPPKEVKAPDQIVSIDEAKGMYDNYTVKRAELIEATETPLEDGSKFIASRYGDYDIETIKNYIAYVEQEAKAAGVKVETLRFYFSTYPDKKEFPNRKKVMHPRQNSFFIVPTMKVDTMNYAFYIKNLGDGKKEAALIRDYPNLNQNGMGAINQSNKSYASLVPSFSTNVNTTNYQGNGSLIMNEGHMGPPPFKPDF